VSAEEIEEPNTENIPAGMVVFTCNISKRIEATI